ncbi:copper resistance protein B [uncultured Brevundimonas sp.]|uniref:copper resistance protein B n=1 Tax=uncultured Brevundimonas sp. TaxID=213418 RepID=UPI0026311D1F|nr:copper resistance protein B [uncultured Brevundimonas sp.]
MIRFALLLAPLAVAAAPHGALAQDPHAGHVMPRPAPTPAPTPAPAPAPAPVQDPHAGHAMPAPPTPAAQDPDAGQRPPDADPHAGHGPAATAGGPPDAPTSADDPGRPAEPPAPAAAFGGPVHAADLVFGPEAMAASRRIVRAEHGDIRTTAVIVDRLEASFGDSGDAWLWDAQGWSGGDINRFWWKSEGDGEGGDVEEAALQALYSRAVAPFWDVQAGLRQDIRADGPDATHLVIGVQGLAPHWWEVDAAAFLSTDGDLTARVEAEYDQRITQRWILQPRLGIELSAGDSPELGLGSGLSSVEAGLRLRYEVRREFAPYAGVEWSRAFGAAAEALEARGGEAEDLRLVVGLRAWF